MPIYEYACKTCGEQFEIFQSISDRPLKRHDACGGELRKVFHPAGLVFKGSGFYTTDSRSPKREEKGSQEKKEKAEKKKGKEKTETSSDASSKDG